MKTSTRSDLGPEGYISFCRPRIPELLRQISPQYLIGNIPPERWSESGERPTHILSVGKAARQMSESLTHLFSIPVPQTLTILPEGYPPPEDLPFVTGNHPYPGTGSQNAARQALSFVQAIPPDGSLLCGISGGASSLLFLPAPGLDPGIKSELLFRLMSKGAPIDILNLVRIHLSSIKGGGLLREFRGRGVRTVLLSDTPCLPPELVGSGPTFFQPRDGEKAISILQEWLSPEEIPGIVQQTLRSPQNDPAIHAPEFPAILLGNSETVLQRAAALLAPEGIQPELLTACLSGDAQEAGKVLGSIIRWKAHHQKKTSLFLATGETTVTLREESGQGGRTLELGLSLGLSLRDTPAVIGSLATDGLDGNSGLSGILLDTTSIQGESVMTRIRKSLRMHNTGPLAQAEGFSLQYGPSGTNLNDLIWVYLPHPN